MYICKYIYVHMLVNVSFMVTTKQKPIVDSQKLMKKESKHKTKVIKPQ